MGYWDNVKGRWQGMVDGDWNKVVDFNHNPPSNNHNTGHNTRNHGHHSELVNERITLQEGGYQSWKISISNTTSCLLTLQYVDGDSITAYLLNNQEYCNFQDNRQFYPTTKLYDEGRANFHLDYGEYYLVAYLSQRQDGRRGRAVALLRLDQMI